MRKRRVITTLELHKISISLVLLNLVINVKRFFLKYKDNIRAFLKIILRLWVNLVSK
jgi:hypothetical protein